MERVCLCLSIFFFKLKNHKPYHKNNLKKVITIHYYIHICMNILYTDLPTIPMNVLKRKSTRHVCFFLLLIWLWSHYQIKKCLAAALRYKTVQLLCMENTKKLIESVYAQKSSL